MIDFIVYIACTVCLFLFLKEILKGVFKKRNITISLFLFVFAISSAVQLYIITYNPYLYRGFDEINMLEKSLVLVLMVLTYMNVNATRENR